MPNWSQEQLEFFELLKSGNFCVRQESVAGSGKTSVGVEGARYLPGGSRFLAFNKSIADELAGRLPLGMASTFHKYCLDYLRMKMGRLEIDGYKNYKLLKKLYPNESDDHKDISRVVGLMKNMGFGILEPLKKASVRELIVENDLCVDPAKMDLFIEAAGKVFQQGLKDKKVIDFDDMLYLPLLYAEQHGWRLPQLPVVVQDEAQDTNAVQLALLQKMTDNVIALGDSHQAIYGFRGAGTDSMNAISQMFGATSSLMSYSWRCPQAVAAHARQWVPYFKSGKDYDGSVSYRDMSEAVSLINNDTLVICRNNFPLYSVALKLLRNRVDFRITGNYTARLIAFIKRFKTHDIREFGILLRGHWEQREAELLEGKKFGALSRERDRFDCLMELQRECVSVPEMIQMLTDMMTSSTGPLLTTVHGAKGLEAKRVLILRPDLMPSEYAHTEAAIQQEYNLMYVAATRALDELIYLEKGA